MQIENHEKFFKIFGQTPKSLGIKLAPFLSLLQINFKIIMIFNQTICIEALNIFLELIVKYLSPTLVPQTLCLMNFIIEIDIHLLWKLCQEAMHLWIQPIITLPPPSGPSPWLV